MPVQPPPPPPPLEARLAAVPIIEPTPITPVNSLGSYFSLKFSKRFESSSNTLLFARTDFTMSLGCTSCRSKSSNLCLNLNLSDALASSFARASPPAALNALEPDHFSYFSSRERILSSRLGDCGAVSLSELVGLGLGWRGGGEAGGWGAVRGLGAVARFAHGGLVIFARLELLLGRPPLLPLFPLLLFAPPLLLLLLLLLFNIWAANLGKGKDKGPSWLLSRNRLGSLGTKFSGLSSTNGVPGRDPS